METTRSATVITEKFSLDQMPGQLSEAMLHLADEFHDPDTARMLKRLRDHFKKQMQEPANCEQA